MKPLTQKIAPMIVLCALSSCRADDAAESGATAKSLDNLTRGDRALVSNKCGVYLTPASIAKFVPEDRAKLKHIHANSDAAAYEAAGVFMAVPKPIQTMFFAAGGSIQVVADANAYCQVSGKSPDQKVFASEASPTIDSCWVVNDSKLDVIVRDDLMSMHHGLVRNFGYVYTQLFGDFVMPSLRNTSDGQGAITKALLRFRTQRVNIGKALLQDLADDPKDVRDHFSLLAKSEPLDYANFVMADAIDSYYCSSDTRATFKTQFPATWKAFTEGELALVKDLGDPIIP